MNPSSKRNRPHCALRFCMIPAACLVLAVIHAIPSVANATYDPKHGRWLQRDPLGVRPDPPRGRIAPRRQYTDGMDSYEYVRCRPSTLEDPNGLSCCAWVTIKDAYGLPYGARLGLGHLALELDRHGKKTLIELAGYRDDRHAESNQVGYGPLGPTMYVMYASYWTAMGLTDEEDLKEINELARQVYGMPLYRVIDLWSGSDYLPGTPKMYYGLYVSPGLRGRGQRYCLNLGDNPCSKLDDLEAAAKLIGDMSINQANMIINIHYYFTDVFLWFDAERDMGDAHFWVGYGYDYKRNSNSFIGTVMRNSQVEAPREAERMLGFDVTFTDWRWWDLKLQAKIQAAFTDKLDDRQ